MSESLLKILEKQISKTLTEILISKMKNNEQIAIEENTNIKNIEKVNKEEIIKEYGEDFYNALDKTAKGINEIFRKNNCKNNEFMTRMYEKTDKLREEEENKNK